MPIRTANLLSSRDEHSQSHCNPRWLATFLIFATTTLFFSCGANIGLAQEESGSVIETGIKPLLSTYCGKCHGGDESEGDFSLADLKEEHLDAAAREQWEDVGRVITDHDMPPEDEPQPTEQERKQITDWIKSSAAAPKQGQLVRRMNRIEYENTIRDLFLMSRDAFANPEKPMIVSTSRLFHQKTMILKVVFL